jgi:DNA mismatch repair protein MutS
MLPDIASAASDGGIVAPLPSAVSAVPSDDLRVTPMMAQYVEIKAANPDCLLFYRMGDFYELFFEDAEIASRTLGIVLTRRGKHAGQDIPMCGVPVERSDDYLHRLIAAGHRVAVCEQIEDPAEAKKRGGKSVVRRAVVRLVTPGTLTEEKLLEPGRANLLVAVARRRTSSTEWRYGLAHLDLSTGRFGVLEADGPGLGAELARLDPSEIVVPDVIRDDPDLKPLWRDGRAAITPVARDGLDPASAERRLKEFYGVATLDSFGAFTRAELAAAGIALGYVARTQFGSRANLSPPSRAAGPGLLIDPATRANLELTRTLAGERAGSLLASVDRTVTAAGARLLAERLAGPLTDVAAIARRQDAVALFVEDRNLRDRLRNILAQTPDFARALSRLSLGRGGPRDLACLRDGAAAAWAAREALASGGELPDELAEAVATLEALDPGLPAALRASLADDLPPTRRDGGFIREGFDPALDEARELGRDSRRVIAALQARYAAETGCRTLRIKHNNVLGYFVEVPQAFGDTLLGPDWRHTFTHRQSMAGAMRFITTEVAELEARIASASDRALAIELSHFDDLAARATGAAGPLAAAADALAALDVTAALADLAADGGWTRPHLETGLTFAIEGGRHPVVEAALAGDGQAFIANDCDLSEEGGEPGGSILLVTGPNMGGKSTFLRQNALLVVLAQAGSFVPARSARIGIVDRLFSRVGAADDLARGRSTFMVEMVETAAILNQATERSLVILDEIGRGTATFDGLSIAWAAIEHLHERNRCRALFATHYHELTALADRLPRLWNATLRVTEWNGDVVFLHEVVPGAADRSYGLQVARLAGLPRTVVERARTILTELERSDRERPRAALVDDLPLFAAARQAPAPARPEADPLREALAAIDPDELTPRGALDALYLLKSHL